MKQGKQEGKDGGEALVSPVQMGGGGTGVSFHPSNFQNKNLFFSLYVRVKLF